MKFSEMKRDYKSSFLKNNGEKIAMTVKTGDKVLYGKYSGTEVKIDGTDYLIMRESDILATL